MAYFWVQQWVALPLIVEEQMGDTTQNNSGLDPNRPFQHQFGQEDPNLLAPKLDGSFLPSPGSSRNPSGNAAFFSQYSAIPSPQRMDNSRFPQQQGYAAGGNQGQPGSSFNMGAMSSALADYSQMPTSGPQQPQRRLSGASTPAVVYQMQQNLQYPHQSSGGFGGSSSAQGPHGLGHGQYPSYNQPQNSQASAYSQLQGQQRMGGVPQHYGGYSPVSPQFYYYPGATGYPQMSFGAPGAQMQTGMGGRAAPNVVGGSDFDAQQAYGGVDAYSGMRRQAPEASPNSVPRGPPRKPKQSGHALWVGNLPPGATVMELKDHFSRDATKDIESLFLISKSNCAFVNYRTETACQAAMQRFHDSRFNGVRLVCRLRRSSTTAPGVPTAPAAMAGRRPSGASSAQSPLLETKTAGKNNEENETAVEEELSPAAKVGEKFFVVKSLTLQDLEQSVRNGIWATQSHNEQVLNKAFEAADNVYLIFSANKSGEYFGYARMTSPINENAAEIMRTLPQNEPTESEDAPKTIPTPATQWAPKGKIIDDSARGTIFWEAELSDEDEDKPAAPAPEKSDSDQVEAGAAQVWGKPFKIEWVSTNRLPFYRTRGLRNPWNANREVKIARDGTELETSVGKRLVQMFHRPGPAPAAQMPMMHNPAAHQMQMPMGGPNVLY